MRSSSSRRPLQPDRALTVGAQHACPGGPKRERLRGRMSPLPMRSRPPPAGSPPGIRRAAPPRRDAVRSAPPREPGPRRGARAHRELRDPGQEDRGPGGPTHAQRQTRSLIGRVRSAGPGWRTSTASLVGRPASPRRSRTTGTPRATSAASWRASASRSTPRRARARRPRDLEAPRERPGVIVVVVRQGEHLDTAASSARSAGTTMPSRHRSVHRARDRSRRPHIRHPARGTARPTLPDIEIVTRLVRDREAAR
jgi:hypothetical protein